MFSQNFHQLHFLRHPQPQPQLLSQQELQELQELHPQELVIGQAGHGQDNDWQQGAAGQHGATDGHELQDEQHAAILD